LCVEIIGRIGHFHRLELVASSQCTSSLPSKICL
jgi:hypothetical protein